MSDYEELGRLKEDIDPIIHDLSARIDKELVIVATTDGSTSSQHSDDPIKPSRPFHLKLQLPHFTGDLLYWKDFWDLFSAVIEGERLSDREKICHLQASMKSEDAKTVVRHAAAKGSYDDVVTALKKRYDKSRVVYMHHVSALTSRAPILSTCEDLVHGLQELELHHSGLKAHGGDTLGQYLTSSTVLLMDPTCATHWADYTSSRGEPPDLETVRSFFEHRIATLQSNPHTAKKSAKPPSVVPSSSKPKDKSRSTVYHARDSPFDPLCPACGEDHSVYQCPSFKGWALDKRFSTVKKKHLCSNYCLGRGHSKESCQSKRTCRECSGRHHTLLHKPDNSSFPSTTDQPRPQGTQVLC